MARAIIAAFIALIWSTAALADSWAPPTVQTYTSANGRFRLTVTPRGISTPLAYFEDKVAKREPAGQATEGAQKASGLLEERLSDGKWRTVWNAILHNEVSPVSAIVADDGVHIVTFDNWHSMGFGNDAIAIYGADGRLIRALALTDIVSRDFVAAFPRSVSSIWWRRDARFAQNNALIVDVVSPTVDRSLSDDADKVPVVPITLDLPTGKVTHPTGSVWDAALVGVHRVAVAELASMKQWNAPIAAPASADEADWHHYVRELAYRLDDGWEDRAISTQTLRLPSAKDYPASVKWLRDELTGKDLRPDIVAIGSPDPANLLKELGKIAPKIKPGLLSEAGLYIALPPAAWPQVEAMFVRSGAKLILIDPARLVPQRRERTHDIAELEAAVSRTAVSAEMLAAYPAPAKTAPEAQPAIDPNALALDAAADALEDAAEALTREAAPKR